MALAPFTAIPLKLLYLILFSLLFLLKIVKNRFFWSGSGYFTIMSFVGASLFHFLYMLISYFVESAVPVWQILDRLLQILLTPAFAVPTYWLMMKWEKFFFENPAEQLSHEYE